MESHKSVCEFRISTTNDHERTRITEARTASGEGSFVFGGISICSMVMKLCPIAARIWSAVTCHRFWRFGDLSPKQGRVQRPGRVERLPAFDGDKSPAESAEKSAHSNEVAASPRWEKCGLG